MNPENENNLDDPFLRTIKWLNPGDHSIQPVFDTIGRQVDVTNVIYDYTFNIDTLNYKQGFMPKKAFHDLPHDTTLTVVAWAERDNPDDNWDIYFRVVYWYTDISSQYVLAMTNPEQISNSESADQTNPAVTAYLTQLMPMSVPSDGDPQNYFRYAADIYPNLVVDIAYQRSSPGHNMEVRYQQYLASMNEWNGIPGFGPFVPAPSGEFLLPTPFSGIDGDYKHPDIVFYSFPPGDEDNNACNALFAAYEFESITANPENDFYAIVAVAGPVDGGGIHWCDPCDPWIVSLEPKIPQQGYPSIWPQYPRIDAGVDSAVGYTIFGVAWHEWITDVASTDIDSRLNIILIDMWFSGPPYTWLMEGIHYDPAIYCAFPYIDIDPLEKYLVDDSDDQPPTPTGLPSYTNVVVTEGQNPNNDTFKVGYWNSATGYVDVIYALYNRRSGFATISMYALQSWEDDDYDFDVVFVSDHEVENTYPVYSCKCWFDGSWTAIQKEPPSQISDDGHESSWDDFEEPLGFGPVGAIFDWRNEEVAWTYKASGPNYLHHVFGDYDFYW